MSFRVRKIKLEGSSEIFVEEPIGVACVQKDTLLLAKEICQEAPCKVLDVGTGYIAILLSKMGFKAEGLDNDSKALNVAEENAKKNKVSIKFFYSDLLSEAGKYDIIVFNPPVVEKFAFLRSLGRRLPFRSIGGRLGSSLFRRKRMSLLERFLLEAGAHQQGKFFFFC